MPTMKADILGFEGCVITPNPPDFTIKVDDYHWRVHSSVISKGCTFFEKVCNGQFMEAQQREVILHDDCPWVVARMLQFFYYGRWSRTQHQTNGNLTLSQLMGIGGRAASVNPVDELDEHRDYVHILAKLYQMADKYDAKQLYEKTKQQLIETPFALWSEVLTIMETIGYGPLRCNAIFRTNYRDFNLFNRLKDRSTLPRLKQLLADDKDIAVDDIESLEDAHLLYALKSTKSPLFSDTWVEELKSHLEIANSGTVEPKEFDDLNPGESQESFEMDYSSEEEDRYAGGPWEEEDFYDDYDYDF